MLTIFLEMAKTKLSKQEQQEIKSLNRVEQEQSLMKEVEKETANLQSYLDSYNFPVARGPDPKKVRFYIICNDYLSIFQSEEYQVVFNKWVNTDLGEIWVPFKAMHTRGNISIYVIVSDRKLSIGNDIVLVFVFFCIHIYLIPMERLRSELVL